MATLSSTTLPLISSTLPHSIPRRSLAPGRCFCRKQLPRRGAVVAAAKRDAYGRGFEGDLVDEDMIVLRKRIHEMKVAEGEEAPPEEWMEWEKRYYAKYNSDVCEAMGLLQRYLLGVRPSVALGALGLVVLSLTTSAVVVSSHLVDVVRTVVLSGVLHLR